MDNEWSRFIQIYLPTQHLPRRVAQVPVIVPLRLLHSRLARHVPFIVFVFEQSVLANRTILINGNTAKIPVNRITRKNNSFAPKQGC